MARPLPEDEKARAVQLELFRRATHTRRLELARSLSASTIELSRAAIRQRHPDWNEESVLLEFARVHYGDELAARVRAYLAARSR
jgi:hypothetical protein